MRALVSLLLLAALGAAAEPDKVEGLIAALRSESPKTRYGAAKDLGKRGADARAALPALLELLGDTEPWVAEEAARSLARIGIGPRQVDAVARRMAEAAPGLAAVLSEALADAGAPAFPAVSKLLDRSSARVRTQALATLGRLGRHAAPAIPKLVELANDKHPGVSRGAAEALRRLAPWSGGVVDELLDLLRFAPEERTRWLAARVLAGAGPAAKAAIPHLEELIREGTPQLKQAAAEALRLIDVVDATERAPPPHPNLRKPHKVDVTAPEKFRVRFESTKGDFVVEFVRSWAPHGVDRVYGLVGIDYFRQVAVFRVLEGFVAQFGIHGDAKVSTAWQDATIEDDERRVPNRRGTVTYAMAGPGTRTTQLFVNLSDNAHLDRQGFAPVGKVVEGLDVVESFFAGYRDAPDQAKIEYEGNPYLKREFPRLDIIRRAVLVPPAEWK